MPHVQATGTAADCTSYVTNPRDAYDPLVNGSLFTIRVVLHAIADSNSTTGLITDECLSSGIRLLNDAFRPPSSNSVRTGVGESSPDTGIHFVLATTDPDGFPTTGIVRHASTDWYTRNHDPGEGIWSAAWDQSRYLNIFLKGFIGDDTTMGYAKFPFSLPAADDGVMMRTTEWGACTPIGDDAGATAAHEIGHYLGLFHTFSNHREAGNSTHDADCPPRESPSCSTTGDLICDTNPESIAHSGCTQSSSCGTADPIHNYMAYTDSVCTSRFTAEQVRRMRCALISYRPGIYTTSAMPPAPPVSPAPPPRPPPSPPPPLPSLPPPLAPAMAIAITGASLVVLCCCASAVLYNFMSRAGKTKSKARALTSSATSSATAAYSATSSSTAA